MKKVLILGGGFAGLESAIYLRKEGFNVTLVSDREYFYIYPTSIWIPTGEVKQGDISIDLLDLANKHGFKLIVDGVVGFDGKNKSTTLKSGRVLEDYYYVVLALGQDKLKHSGAKNTLSICGHPQEATQIYHKLDSLVKKGSGKISFGFGGNPKDKSAVRGGPVFEVLFNVDNYLRKKGIRDNFELTFFAPMAKPGEKMGEKSLNMMDKMFKSKNINKKIGTKITNFTENSIEFADETALESDLIIFTPAGKGHHIYENSGLPLSEAGYIITDKYSQIENFDGIYAIGDSANLLGPKFKAKQGHLAEVMARNLAYNIKNHSKDIADRKEYVSHVNILCVMDMGNGAGFVYRDEKRALMIPMPIFGHWLKKGWGWYCKNSKLGKIPRIKGM